jgi:hypothetical protein
MTFDEPPPGAAVTVHVRDARPELMEKFPEVPTPQLVSDELSHVPEEEDAPEMLTSIVKLSPAAATLAGPQEIDATLAVQDVSQGPLPVWAFTTEAEMLGATS